MAFNPFSLAPTFTGPCQADKMDLPPCSATEVVEVSVSQQGLPKQVLGTLCKEHAEQWYFTHVRITE